MSDYTQSYRKYPPSLRLSSIYCELYKPSDLVGLVKNGFNGMLNLGLSFPRVLGPIRSTYILLLGNFCAAGTLYMVKKL